MFGFVFVAMYFITDSGSAKSACLLRCFNFFDRPLRAVLA